MSGRNDAKGAVRGRGAWARGTAPIWPAEKETPQGCTERRETTPGAVVLESAEPVGCPGPVRARLVLRSLCSLDGPACADPCHTSRSAVITSGRGTMLFGAITYTKRTDRTSAHPKEREALTTDYEHKTTSVPASERKPRHLTPKQRRKSNKHILRGFLCTAAWNVPNE